MEQVFVVRRQDFFAGDWPQGFVAADTGLLRRLADAGFFVDRPAAEANPDWKQPIPYCVIRRPGQVFCVERKTAQSEQRLHRMRSIGLGGHVNPMDGVAPAAGPAFFRAALNRELEEELHGVGPAAPDPVFHGLLNDDDTAVGRVHAGLVYTLDWPAEAPADGVSVREIDKMAGGFVHLADLGGMWQDPLRFESWSRILIEAGVAGSGLAGSAVAREQRSDSAPPERAERNNPDG